MTATSLITKYRPISFGEVSGNEIAVKALEQSLAQSTRHHAYLLTGPSGCGKTTLARIIAKSVNAFVEEIDAASNSGVDDMRAIVQAAQYQPILSGQNKLIIIDEVHALSKGAFQALLKLIEEPPSYLYFALATTELTKVPETIKTRCHHVLLKALKHLEMRDYVALIADLEEWTLTPEVLEGIVLAATGQPRKALSILQQGHTAKTTAELATVVAEVERESSVVIELCRSYLLKGNPKNWDQTALFKLLKEIEYDEDPAAIVVSYCSSVFVGSTDFVKANAVWRIIDAFTFPRATFDKKAQFVAALGAYMFGGQ